MASVLRAVAASCAALVLLPGCGDVPASSPVRVVRDVPSKGPEPPPPGVDRRLPKTIPADATPDEIVSAFLHAQGQPAGVALARRHLAPQATWDPTGRTTVIASRDIGQPVIADDRATVKVTLRPLGRIAASGEFRPRSQRETLTFTLRLVQNVGWRISEAPAVLALSAGDVPSAFQRVTLYWPNPSRRLAPDVVFVRASDQPVAEVVQALLLGPSAWLAPAVRNAIPKGTKLLGEPTLVDGVLTLNFSREIGGVPQETLGTLVAQVVWTMTERPEVQVVRLFAEGVPITLRERPALRDHRRSDWAAYAPVPATTDRRLFFVQNGVASALDDDGRLSKLAATPPLASVAVNRQGTMLAAVTRRVAGRQSLLLIELTGEKRSRTALTADLVSAPTWEPSGDTVWVARTSGLNQQVVAVPAAGDPMSVVPVSPALPASITSLRLSPDGARAAVVAGGSVWLTRVERPASGGRTLGEPLEVVQSVPGVTAVAFDGPSRLLFAAQSRPRPALYRVDVDGFALVAQRNTGLPAGAVSALAVSVGDPADRVASVANRLWRRAPAGDWAPLQWEGAVAATFAG